MAGICFYFEDYDIDVYSGRRIDLDAWNYAIQAGGPDMQKLFMLNRTSQIITTPNAALDFETISVKGSDIFPDLEGKSAFFVPPTDSRSQISLWDFSHDVDWYCFGPANIFEFVAKSQDVVVSIPMPNQIKLHAAHSASVVMTHRYHVRYK